MSEQLIASNPRRFVPPLPANIPILPDQVRRAKRSPRFRLIIFLAVGALLLFRFHSCYSQHVDVQNDIQQINAVMTQAMLTHPAKGARFPVTLSSGERILQINFAWVQYPYTPIGALPSGHPKTCVMVNVLDPKTGTKDPNYESGNMTCIEGLVYRIM
jgi:hypothetical protein